MSNMNVTRTRVNSGMVENSCSISGTHRVCLAKHLMICHEESQEKLVSGLNDVCIMLSPQIHINSSTKELTEIVLRSEFKGY